ncbi:MAG: hypothetical protein P8Y67_02145 [Alphaproteobacteria bacterium]
MTITVEAYTGADTITTMEWSLSQNSSGPGAEATEGVFQTFIDLNALAAGDVFEFRAYEKVRTGDTQRAIYSAQFSGPQVTSVWASPTLILGVGWDMTLKKISGTDRTINWRISQVA